MSGPGRKNPLDARIASCAALLRGRRYGDILKRLESVEVAGSHSQLAAIHYLRGVAQHELGNGRESHRSFARAGHQMVKSPISYLTVSDFLVEGGSPERACSLCLRIVDRARAEGYSPDLVFKAHVAASRVLFRMDRYEQAADQMKMALKMRKAGEHSLLLAYGYTLIRLGKVGRGVSMINKYLAAGGELQSRVHVMLGEGQFKAKRFRQARDEFEMALRLDKRNADATEGLRVVSRMLEQTRGA